MKSLTTKTTQEEPNCSPKKINTHNQYVRISSEALMAGHKRVEILHDNEIYQLSLTKSRKLILTK